jgi:hypothetical protein
MRTTIILVCLLALSCHARPARPARPAPPSPPAAAAPRFACGTATCDAGAEYCQMIKTDDLRLPSTYSCQPLPSSCAGADAACGCFPAAARCDYCAVLDGGGARHVQRTCVGGR